MEWSFLYVHESSGVVGGENRSVRYLHPHKVAEFPYVVSSRILADARLGNYQGRAEVPSHKWLIWLPSNSSSEPPQVYLWCFCPHIWWPKEDPHDWVTLNGSKEGPEYDLTLCVWVGWSILNVNGINPNGFAGSKTEVFHRRMCLRYVVFSEVMMLRYSSNKQIH